MTIQPAMMPDNTDGSTKGLYGRFPRSAYALNIPGRLRIRVDILKDRPVLCGRVTEALSAVPGISAVTANPYTAKALIIYDTDRITLREIEPKLWEILPGGKKRTPEKSKVIKANFRFQRPLSPGEFMKSRNALSAGYRSFTAKAIHSRIAGITDDITEWYNLPAGETERRLNTDSANGLSPEEAGRRLEKLGPNTFDGNRKKSVLAMLLGQLEGFIVKLLLAASGISLLLGQAVDAAAILVIIGVEAFIGAWQEYKASKSLDLLKDLSTPEATVIREGSRRDMPAWQLVPGDILCLEAGDIVPADARLVESRGLQAVESSLTGEAYPVYKRNAEISCGDVPLGDRSNMVYRGTSIVKGHGKAVVVATGMQTEMGRISGLLGGAKPEKTPLQKDLDRLARFITWGCLGICAVITLGGILGGNPLPGMFATGVSLAVGAIPEGLTTVLAISLAFGTQRLAQKNAIVKSLPSMETLSCSRVICTDKTGTLTRNEMTVKGIYTLNQKIHVTGEGYHSRGSFQSEGRRVFAGEHAELKALMTAAALCNNAELTPSGNKSYRIKGDPTEAALLIAVEKSGIEPEQFKCYKREHEIPFDPESKRMTAICSDERGNRIVFVKGAVDIVLEHCTHVMAGESHLELTPGRAGQIREANGHMADKAWRVLALAYKPLNGGIDPGLSAAAESELVFIGLVGIMDPPRPEVAGAIRKCHDAGIRVVMITGDHKNTAAAVARSVGLLTGSGVVLSSEEMDSMPEEELLAVLDRVEVFARSCPEQKLKIVQAYKKKGHIVAMTGDGVNDAPALKEAHIGIAMGRSGTDIAKDASSIILTDDNFNTVMKAVEEGRTVHRNIRKFMKYVLSGNLAEVLAIFLASVAGKPSPLIPAQILMLNLVTEGIPALSLGVDPPEGDIMKEPPRDPEKSIFDRKIRNRILTRGVATGMTTLGLFGGALFFTGSVMRARTIAFANLVSCQMLHAFECSSMGVRRNKYLLPSVVISTGILLASIYVPPLAGIFGMVPLKLADWAAILISTVVLSRMDDFLKDVLYLANLRQKPSFGV